MAAWGIGLYSSDFALDVRGAVNAVSRLPFPPDRRLDYLCAAEPTAANDPKDRDHTVSWLTVADQFAKRRIDCADARDRALAIITDGADLAAMAALGRTRNPSSSAVRCWKGLRRRIAAPIETAKPRPVLKAPQKLLLGVGEVLAYPLCKGDPINPYTVGPYTVGPYTVGPYTVGKDWAWVKA